MRALCKCLGLDASGSAVGVSHVQQPEKISLHWVKSVNAFHQNRGAAAVFRTIPAKVMTMEALGPGPIFNTIADAPRGLVIVTGPDLTSPCNRESRRATRCGVRMATSPGLKRASNASPKHTAKEMESRRNVP